MEVPKRHAVEPPSSLDFYRSFGQVLQRVVQITLAALAVRVEAVAEPGGKVYRTRLVPFRPPQDRTAILDLLVGHGGKDFANALDEVMPLCVLHCA